MNFDDPTPNVADNFLGIPKRYIDLALLYKYDILTIEAQKQMDTSHLRFILDSFVITGSPETGGTFEASYTLNPNYKK